MPEAVRREVDKMLRGLAPKHQRQLSVSSSNALERFAVIEAVLSHRKLVLLLDYDGTLTPIVKDPSKALLSDRVRTILKELPKHFITGVISGRSLGKIRSFVDVKGLFYAGSHGFDILAPSHSAYSGASGIESTFSENRTVSTPTKQPSASSSSSSSSQGAEAAAAARAMAGRAASQATAAGATCLPVSNGVNGGTSGAAEGGEGSSSKVESNGAEAECGSGAAGSGRAGGGDKNDHDCGGSNGIDTGTVLEEVRHQVAQEYLPVMETIRDQLVAELKGIKNSEVEDNHFSVSIHYRNCARDDVPKVREVVERVQKRHERIRMGSGKEVFELQPDIEWDKGKAVLWLLDKLVVPMAKAPTDEEAAAVVSAASSAVITPASAADATATMAAAAAAGGGSNGTGGGGGGGQDEDDEDESPDRFFTIFIGDDKTDENAFRALNGDMAGSSASHEGVGILVSEESRETNAAYTLRNPDEVACFLEKIAELGRERCRSGVDGSRR